jgi:hypothetical protein
MIPYHSCITKPLIEIVLHAMGSQIKFNGRPRLHKQTKMTRFTNACLVPYPCHLAYWTIEEISMKLYNYVVLILIFVLKKYGCDVNQT